MHKHQSPMRSGVFLDEAATIEFYGSHQGWTLKMVKEQILNVYNKKDVSKYLTYDKSSIMQYPVPKELTRDGKNIPYSKTHC
jgi:hypothetical protein